MKLQFVDADIEGEHLPLLHNNEGLICIPWVSLQWLSWRNTQNINQSTNFLTSDTSEKIQSTKN